MTLDDAVALAGLYALRDVFDWGTVLSTDTMRQIDALLRPLMPQHEPWSPTLRLGERIAEAEM